MWKLTWFHHQNYVSTYLWSFKKQNKKSVMKVNEGLQTKIQVQTIQD